MAESEQTKEAAAGETVEADGFASLLQKQFKPQTDRAKDEVESAVRTLAQHALEKSTLIGSDVVESINAMIAAIDQKMSAQINAIVHHPDFQQLEAAWRGLHHLVNNTETDEMLKIRVMNISKKEVHKTLRKFKGTAWDSKPHLQEAI
jgi:type VI secretion system protein ImpC